MHRELHPPKLVDPFEILPQELILLMMTDYFTYKETVFVIVIDQKLAWVSNERTESYYVSPRPGTDR